VGFKSTTVMRGGWPGGVPDEADEEEEEDAARRFAWREDGAVDAVDAVVEDVARRVVWF
jgi:hypothetical protein